MTRAEAARINGAQSKGPVTEEGKARAARNATTHGLNASDVVIVGEDESAFEALLASLHESWKPLTAAERDLVFEIAANRWRLRRIRRMEKDVMNAEIHRLINDPDNPVDPAFAEATAFQNLAAGPALKMIHRYESRLRRSCEKAEKELKAMDARCPEPVLVDDICMEMAIERDANQNLQNEPDAQGATSAASPQQPLAVSSVPVPQTASTVVPETSPARRNSHAAKSRAA